MILSSIVFLILFFTLKNKNKEGANNQKTPNEHETKKLKKRKACLMSDKQQCFYFVFCVYKEAHLLWQNDILSLIVIVLNVITLFFHIRINQIFHVNVYVHYLFLKTESHIIPVLIIKPKVNV